MNKLNKIALVISTAFAGNAFAASADLVQYDFYGQIGGAMKTEELQSTNLNTSAPIDDDFGFYSDTHIGGDIDFQFTKNLSIQSEFLVDFDETEDVDVELKELTFKGDWGKYQFKVGRFMNPLYMNSSSEYRDFERLTFRDNNVLSARGGIMEGLDGGMFGYSTKLNGMKAHFNIYSGIPTNIEGDSDTETYKSTNTDPKFTFAEFDRESEYSITAENLLQSKYGDFRIAASYIDFKGLAPSDDETYGQYLFDLGYTHKVGNLLLEAEFAHSIVDIHKDYDIDEDQFNITVGYEVSAFTPYVSYTLDDSQLRNDTEEYIEAGVHYTINKHFKIKTAYEMTTDEDGNENDIISAGLAIQF